MKRTTALLLTPLLLLTLTGCDKKEEIDTSLDSNRAFIHYESWEQVCETEDTVYFTGSSGQLVHYYEKATGVSGVLCGKAECEHSTAGGSKCNAYIGSSSGDLCVYNNRLYWIDGWSNICSMALDGTDHRRDRTRDAELYSDHTGGSSSIFHRGFAYTWVKNYTVRDGKEVVRLDFAAIPLNPDEEPHMIFQEELSDIAVRYSSTIVMHAYGDNIYILTNAVGTSHEDDPEARPEFYDLQIRRCNVVTEELTTLYHDSQSHIDETVEMWATDDGLLFSGFWDVEGEYSDDIYKLDFESGELVKLFSIDHIPGFADNLIAESQYDSEKFNPTNPWGFAFSPQDIERSGEWNVVIRSFDGDIILEDTYRLEGLYDMLLYFKGADDTYAYFFSETSYNDDETNSMTTYMSIIGVALDGSGMEVLSSEEELYAFPTSGGGRGTSTTVLDDGTTILVKDHKEITVIPGDGGETITMTVEELLENGYQP